MNMASRTLLSVNQIINATMVPADGANAPSFKQARKMASEFGKHSAAGKDSRPNLGRTACALAEAGTIDQSKCNEDGTPNKDSERDAASWLYSDFAATNKTAKFADDKTDPKSVDVQVSKLRAFVKMGMLPDISGGDVLDRATEIIAECPPRCKPAYDALVEVCRKQIKNPKVALTDDELRAIVLKAPKQAKNIKDRITSVIATVTNIWDDADGETKAKLEDAVNALKEALTLAEKSGQ